MVNVLLLVMILIVCGIEICPISAKSLPKHACEILSDLRDKNDGMKTIALIKGESQLDTRLFSDEFLKCLPMEISIVIGNDTSEEFYHQNQHKHAAVVIMADDIDKVS